MTACNSTALPQITPRDSRVERFWIGWDGTGFQYTQMWRDGDEHVIDECLGTEPRIADVDEFI